MTNDGLQPDAAVYDPHSDAVRLGDQGSTNIHLLELFELGRLRCATVRAKSCYSDNAPPMIGDRGQEPASKIVDSAPTSPIIGDSAPIAGRRLQRSMFGKLPRVIFPISRFEPVHGTAHGKLYAEQCAGDSMDWMRNNDLITAWCVDELLVLALAWAIEVGNSMPRNRNFLSAVKRLPGVKVHADRHVFDIFGKYHGKTTIYDLRGTVALANLGPTIKSPSPKHKPQIWLGQGSVRRERVTDAD